MATSYGGCVLPPDFQLLGSNSRNRDVGFMVSFLDFEKPLFDPLKC